MPLRAAPTRYSGTRADTESDSSMGCIIASVYPQRPQCSKLPCCSAVPSVAATASAGRSTRTGASAASQPVCQASAPRGSRTRARYREDNRALIKVSVLRSCGTDCIPTLSKVRRVRTHCRLAGSATAGVLQRGASPSCTHCCLRKRCCLRDLFEGADRGYAVHASEVIAGLSPARNVLLPMYAGSRSYATPSCASPSVASLCCTHVSRRHRPVAALSCHGLHFHCRTGRSNGGRTRWRPWWRTVVAHRGRTACRQRHCGTRCGRDGNSLLCGW
jgi:hypothetical protein